MLQLSYSASSLLQFRFQKYQTQMRNLTPTLLSSIRRLAYLFSFLFLAMVTICVAEDSKPSQPPTVFLPQETQHGFAEFDTPPDFFEDEAPTTTSAPYKDYSNSPDLPSFDHKPEGLFDNMVFAESVEEDRAIRRGHILIPVNPTDTFPQSAKAVHLVFGVHAHLAPFQVIGRLFPEDNPNLDASQWIDEDRADLALEDESGYLKFFPPDGEWQPGRYRVDVYVGYMVSTVNKMGTMRFSIQ